MHGPCSLANVDCTVQTGLDHTQGTTQACATQLTGVGKRTVQQAGGCHTADSGSSAVAGTESGHAYVPSPLPLGTVVHAGRANSAGRWFYHHHALGQRHRAAGVQVHCRRTSQGALHYTIHMARVCEQESYLVPPNVPASLFTTSLSAIAPRCR